MISFVVYFHSSREENLLQMLRFLFEREKMQKEVVLVCNDRYEMAEDRVRIVNMQMKEYCKPTMCNSGVLESRGEVVALLDSDRILPCGYFESVLKEIKRGEFVSCETIMNLTRPHKDEEIDGGPEDFWLEERSKGWEIRRKNLFSGNTVFHREDYLKSGGMDDSFVGYGFADNDMTKNVSSMGFKSVWREEREIHLYHEKKVMESGLMVGFEEYRKTSQRNLCRFLKKWKMKEYWDHCPHL